ncbi:hypothetical protein [Virgibacillus halodenitrificans]|nr:hypothetical protein [Virgibacillus halodenitrificans]
MRQRNWSLMSIIASMTDIVTKKPALNVYHRLHDGHCGKETGA